MVSVWICCQMNIHHSALCSQWLHRVYWSTGLGHTWAGFIHWYTDLIRCVLARWQLIEVAWQMSGRPSMHVLLLRSTSLNLRGTSSKALIFSRLAKLITFCLRHSFLGKCKWGSMYFLNHQACVGYGPVLGSRNKKCHVPYSHGCGVANKYQQLNRVIACSLVC